MKDIPKVANQIVNRSDNSVQPGPNSGINTSSNKPIPKAK